MFECITSFLKKSKDQNQWLYIIVHGDLVHRSHPAYLAIDRIRREEDFIEVRGDPKELPENLPSCRPIFVCGAYRSLCIKDQCDALRSAGYHADIYLAGTVG